MAESVGKLIGFVLALVFIALPVLWFLGGEDGRDLVKSPVGLVAVGLLAAMILGVGIFGTVNLIEDGGVLRLLLTILGSAAASAVLYAWNESTQERGYTIVLVELGMYVCGGVAAVLAASLVPGLIVSLVRGSRRRHGHSH
ncbi:MAG: hypothetical protein AB7Q42_21285 [Acidimicrobiia bacterium]